MKKQLVLALVVAGTFIAGSASAQPFISARIGFRVPAPRVFCAPPPPVVVYQQPACEPQPVYQDQGYYDQGCDNTVVYENRRPVYYRENVYARPRYVEVNRYRDYHEDRFHDHRDGGYRRW